MKNARRNLHDLPSVTLEAGDVDRVLNAAVGQGLEHVDLVVLDPPRTGAGKDVVRRIAALSPRRIAYVACDPAALARDLKTFGRLGYGVALAAGLRFVRDDPPHRVRRRAASLWTAESVSVGRLG